MLTKYKKPFYYLLLVIVLFSSLGFISLFNKRSDCETKRLVEGYVFYSLKNFRDKIEVPTEDSLCTYSFYEGLFRLSQVRKDNYNRLNEACDVVNSKIPEKWWDQCRFKVGIVATYIDRNKISTDDDLEKMVDTRVKFCEDAFLDTGDCIAGVYTGINIAYWNANKDSNFPIVGGNPFWICGVGKGLNYRLECLRGLVSYVYGFTNNSVEETLKIISDNSKTEEERFEIPLTFFSSLAYFDISINRVAAICLTQTGEFRRGCIQGYATGLVEVLESGNESKGIVEFCLLNVFSRAESSQCLERGFKELYSNSPRRSEQVCKKEVPQRFVSVCNFITKGEHKVLLRNLDIPWEMAFLPNGDSLITERSGKVLLFDKNKRETIKDVVGLGEGGLLGMDVHPLFSQNKFVYLYYTYEEKSSHFNKVVRFVFDGDNFKEDKIIIDKIPASNNHDGGRIKFGPDGKLYITTGDAQNPTSAQDLTILSGKILRANDDGSIPNDNPFPGSYVYSYGHRNPQGISWDALGNLWETEHGQNAHDEINFIVKGKNYGWPEVQGNERKIGMETSIFNSGTETWAPSGAVFVDGKLYFAGLAGRAIFEFDPTTRLLKKHFVSTFGRLRDIVLGPDENFYVLTSNRDGRNETPSEDDDRLIKIPGFK